MPLPSKPVQAPIGQKHQRQPDIFERHHIALAELAQRAAHRRGRNHLQHVIHQQKHGHLRDFHPEPLHHHEPGKDHENLPPRPRHELQRIEQPIAFAQHHMLVLHMRRFKLRIGEIATTPRRRARKFPTWPMRSWTAATR